MTFICMSVSGNEYTFALFIASAVTNAIPGIVVQIVLIPILVMVIGNPKVIRLGYYDKPQKEEVRIKEEK